MKKIVLALICGLIITVFIAFNYLLLDREKFEDINDSKNATIDAFSRQIKNLNDQSNQLSNKIVDMQFENRLLQDQKDRLDQERLKLKESIDQKDDIINSLKRQIDLGQFETVIKKWAELVDKGQYDAAYELMIRTGTQDRQKDLADFTSTYKVSVKNVSVKSVKLGIEEVGDDRKGDLVFKVILDIKRVQNDPKSLFIEGENERYFTIAFDKLKGSWGIFDISSIP